MRNPNYTLPQFKKVIELKSESKSVYEIAEQVGLETGTVQRILAEFKKMNGVLKAE